METPLSMRRLTRSQAAAAAAAAAVVSEKKSAKQDEGTRPKSNKGGNAERSALLDITNDSPIVGLTMVGQRSPASMMVKRGLRAERTPGTGEALLRGQVKTLLQKVEEEAELVNKLQFGEPQLRFPAIAGLGRSPAQLLAPTPANTPQIPDPFSSCLEVDCVDLPCVGAEEPKQVMAAGGRQECLINRALLFDSPGKFESESESEREVLSEASTISSSLSYQHGRERRPSPEDDSSSSIWSIQVNVSMNSDDDDNDDGDEEIVGGGFDEEEESYNYYYKGGAEEEEEEDDLFDDLCEGLGKMSVLDEELRLPEFMGRHTRFVYNDEDEMEGEEEVNGGSLVEQKIVSPGALLLKGLPAPEGKHLRFQEEDQDSQLPSGVFL